MRTVTTISSLLSVIAAVGMRRLSPRLPPAPLPLLLLLAIVIQVVIFLSSPFLPLWLIPCLLRFSSSYCYH